MAHHNDEFLPTRRSLLDALKNLDDQESWRDFFNTYWKLIYNAALKAGLSHSEAEEVVQETVLTVTKKIHDLKYDPALGSFKGWLLTTTRWRVADQFRKRRPTDSMAPPDADDDRQTATIDRVPGGFDWNVFWDAEWEKNLMDAALARAKERVSPKQYQIFDLYVLKDWPVAKVRKTLGVSVAQVYLAKHRVSGVLKTVLKELQTKLM